MQKPYLYYTPTYRLKKKKENLDSFDNTICFFLVTASQSKIGYLTLGRQRERRLQHLQFIQYLSLSVSNRANQSHLLQQGLQGMLYKEHTLFPRPASWHLSLVDWLMPL